MFAVNVLATPPQTRNCVYLNENRGVLDRIPEELNGVEVHGV